MNNQSDDEAVKVIPDEKKEKAIKWATAHYWIELARQVIIGLGKNVEDADLQLLAQDDGLPEPKLCAFGVRPYPDKYFYPNDMDDTFGVIAWAKRLAEDLPPSSSA